MYVMLILKITQSSFPPIFSSIFATFYQGWHCNPNGHDLNVVAPALLPPNQFVNSNRT